MGPKVIPLPYALFHYLLSKAQIKKTTKSRAARYGKLNQETDLFLHNSFRIFAVPPARMAAMATTSSLGTSS